MQSKEIRIHYGNGDKEMNRIEEIIYKGTQKAAYEEIGRAHV